MSKIKQRLEKKARSALVSSADFPDQMAALAIIEIDDAPPEPGYSVADGVGTLQIRGLLAPNVGMDLISLGLTGYDVLLDYIYAAQDDSEVETLRLVVDSNGGFVDGIAQVVTALAEFTKPIETFVEGDMNSGAYWLGCAGQTITALNDQCEIGSIGAYVTHTEFAGMDEQQGVTTRIFKSDYWKGAFNSFTKLSEKEELRLQETVDASASSFRETVANYRNITVDAIKLFDGDSFGAKDAITNNLIDFIGDYPVAETTFTQAEVDAQVADAVKAQVALALEGAAAAQSRTDEIKGYANGTDAAKAMLSGAAFAAVPVAEIKAMLDVSAPAAPTVAQAMEVMGGAGVQADRQDVLNTTETVAQAKASAQKDAVATLSEFKGRVL